MNVGGTSSNEDSSLPLFDSFDKGLDFSWVTRSSELSDTDSIESISFYFKHFTLFDCLAG